MISRPYLLEDVAGSKFDIGAFIALIAFVGVIAFWVYISLPTLQNAFEIFGLFENDIVVPGIKQVITPTPGALFPVR